MVVDVRGQYFKVEFVTLGVAAASFFLTSSRRTHACACAVLFFAVNFVTTDETSCTSVILRDVAFVCTFLALTPLPIGSVSSSAPPTFAFCCRICLYLSFSRKVVSFSFVSSSVARRSPACGGRSPAAALPSNTALVAVATPGDFCLARKYYFCSKSIGASVALVSWCVVKWNADLNRAKATRSVGPIWSLMRGQSRLCAFSRIGLKDLFESIEFCLFGIFVFRKCGPQKFFVDFSPLLKSVDWKIWNALGGRSASAVTGSASRERAQRERDGCTQGCSGAGTRGNGVPTLFVFVCSAVKVHTASYKYWFKT